MPTCESLTKVPELSAFISVISKTINQIAGLPQDSTEIWLKIHSFWSMIHGLVSINLVAPPVSHLNMNPDEFNKAILKDFIKSFIKGLET